MTNLDVDMLNSISAARCSVNVTTSSRLHLGFFDLNGGLGRKFGSIGLSLQAPVTSLSISPSKTFTAEGEGAERAIKIAQQVARHLNVDGGVTVV